MEGYSDWHGDVSIRTKGGVIHGRIEATLIHGPDGDRTIVRFTPRPAPVG